MDRYSSYNKYLLSAYFEVGTVLDPGDQAVNKIKSPSCILVEFSYSTVPNQPRQLPLSATLFVLFLLLNEKRI